MYSGIKGSGIGFEEAKLGDPQLLLWNVACLQGQIIRVFYRLECSLGTFCLALSLLVNSMRKAGQTQPFETSKNCDLQLGAPAVNRCLNCCVHRCVGC